MTNPRSREYTEAEARDILGRAIRIEHLRSERLSLAEIHAAGEEIGVSRAALAAAVAGFEHDRAGGKRSSFGVFARFALAGTALAVAAEGVLGTLTDYSPLGWAPVAATLALMIAGSVATLRTYGSRFRAVLGFQLKNLGLWAGFGISSFAIAVTVGGLQPDDFFAGLFIRVTLLTWAFSSVVGAGLAAWRAKPQTAVPGREEAAPILTRVRRRVGVWLSGWIDHTLVRASRVAA
jgi:hypothetical protein